MSEEKKDDNPDSIRVGFFTYHRGSSEYAVEMEKRDKIANLRAKERFGPGRSGTPIYRLKPRYSSYNAVSLSNVEEMKKFLGKEDTRHGMALEGELGDEMKEIAEDLGKRGIVEKLTPTPLGNLVEDMMTDVRYLQPSYGEDLSGLWELTIDFENPEADRRVKDNWLMMPVWSKGSRFVLARNTASLDILKSVLEEEGVEGDRRKMLEQRAIDRAGYMIRSARGRWARNHDARLDRLPEEFTLALRPVPLNDHQDAIDLVGPEDYNIREVLMHLLKLKGIPPWHFAKLLEQAYHAEGPFEQEEEPDV